MSNLGEIIAESREKLQISQEELAFRIGKSVRTVQLIELNKIVPDQETLLRLSNTLDIPVNNLIFN
ncbi:helix-turn-helix domain-containing protein [Pallidibacillus pasinlerensis]|uniref:Helix-turn-helix transcriptional regulator n=1 Tax=Pallidibacillus pasinlerensis TaxID=2703818 RepID=A0ABX0A869_9BACI|nr:helix-turn-helix transcriptional regulator [Pallidibacillus pasinlerensis]NCU17650.1 helix-turn-helix transcriptional regulator [Pallidibacillus pasinlerensis]